MEAPTAQRSAKTDEKKLMSDGPSLVASRAADRSTGRATAFIEEEATTKEELAAAALLLGRWKSSETAESSEKGKHRELSE